MRSNRRRSSLVSLHGPLRPLAGEDPTRRSRRRPRRFASIDERARQRAPRVALAVLAVLEIVALAVLLAGPAWRVRHIEVAGNQRLTAAQVVAQAGLGRPGSVLMVDPSAVQRRLEEATWIRSSQVSVALPDRVRIRVEEWQPVAVYHAGAGPPYYVSDRAVALGPARPDESLLDVQGPQQPQPRVGRQVMDSRLLTALVNIQRGLPGLIGQEVRSFSIDGCGNLTMGTRRGWRAEFGRVLTPEEFDALKDKLAALRSLAAAGVDFNNPRLQYVNLMNPAAVAVNDGSVRPSPTPTPARGPGSRATARPAPTALVSPPPCR